MIRNTYRSGTSRTTREGDAPQRKSAEVRSGSVQDKPNRAADQDTIRSPSKARFEVRDGRLHVSFDR